MRHERCSCTARWPRAHRKRPRDTYDTGGARRRCTQLNLTATKPCRRLINEVICSTAPLLHCFTAPLLRCFTAPLLRCSAAQLLSCSARLHSCSPRASGHLGLQIAQRRGRVAASVDGARPCAAATPFKRALSESRFLAGTRLPASRTRSLPFTLSRQLRMKPSDTGDRTESVCAPRSAVPWGRVLRPTPPLSPRSVTRGMTRVWGAGSL